MDVESQVYEQDSRGWQRGLYKDIKSTFRAPIVNWIFRTLMANEPEVLRHTWYQIKPIFETRGFAEYSVAFRESILSPAEDHFGIRAYRPEEIDISPAEYSELRSQLATFDVVAPRLAVLFELMNRSLVGDPVGNDPDESEGATAPFPEHIDCDRGAPPTMIPFDGIPNELEATIVDVKRTHGLETGLPSLYRCAAQWPEFLAPVWEEVKPLVTSDVYAAICTDSREQTEAFVESIPYRPQLSPENLRAAGINDSTVEELRSLFADFGYGRPRPVLPTLVLYPALLGVAGPRQL